MTYVTYHGVRPRDPKQALRVVDQWGTAVHVIALDSADEAAQVARRLKGTVHDDRSTAVREALRLSGD